jgi:hypothetical protein
VFVCGAKGPHRVSLYYILSPATFVLTPQLILIKLLNIQH